MLRPARTCTPATSPRRDLPDVDAAGAHGAARRCSLVLLPFNLPVINQLPFVRFLGDPDWIRLTTQAVIFAIAALGLNLLTGVAGQVSLGHAFFMGVGAYAAVVPRRRAGRRTCGATGCRSGSGCRAPASAPRCRASSSRRPRSVCAASTSASSPSAWCSSASTSRGCSPRSPGQPRSGATSRRSSSRWWKEDEPVIYFTDDGHWLWFDISRQRQDVPVLPGCCSSWPWWSPRT